MQYGEAKRGSIVTQWECGVDNLLKGHGDEADFLGFFCINRFGICPLHYISSRSDFGFEFAEIFVIEKRLPDSLCRGVDKIAYTVDTIFFNPLKKSMVIVH
jgi:hypothetical protein